MPRSFAPAGLGIAALCLASLVAPAIAAETRSISIADPFGLAGGPDRIVEPVSFPEGAVSPQGVSLKDAAGAAVPVQLSAVELWPDGTSVKSAVASFMATLAPGNTSTSCVVPGKPRSMAPPFPMKR